MKGVRIGLFWKILVVFWLTYVLILQASWVFYLIYWGDRPSYEQRMAESFAPVQLSAAASAVTAAGPQGFGDLLQQWPRDRREPMELLPAQALPATAFMTQSATAPDGRNWTVAYRLPEPKHTDWSDWLKFYVSADMMVPGAIGGLCFSALLARYLTRPIHRMQRGFARLASGDLEIRLAPEIGNRRDEIADLARDFDHMAGRLQQLVAMRDRLLHDVSHELRSPLARLNLAVALLRRGPQDPAPALDRIETESRRLDELVGELLSLARVEVHAAGQDQYFDLPGLVRAVVGNAQYEARPAGIGLDLQIRDGDTEIIIHGSAELMRRALENVVRNAVQVSRPGQQIVVRLAPDTMRQTVALSVTDEGPGVPQESLTGMFDPFVRVGDGAGRGGYGLGLAIAQRAVAALSGTISAGPGPASRGLRINIVLPLNQWSGADT